MGNYIPGILQEQKEMLQDIGLESFDDLYSVVPEEVRLKELNLENGKSEWEVRSLMERMAAKNTVFKDCYRGAGAYRHYIPAAVKNIVSKEEFVTAYTPYQAEISQGILQSIFEYQTMMCELTGMDVSNASVYDGAVAAAEAVAMCKERKKQVAFVSSCVHPQVIETIQTYCFGNGMKVVLIPEKDGRTDLSALQEMLKEDSACVLIQHPNYYGNLEHADDFAEAAHAFKAKLIMSVNPVSCAVLKTPKEYGADIAVGEGQPLGLSLAFGGPYLGFMCATEAMMRKLPGRIVGETTDDQGRRAFVLTLQAREQHIRREKASSNICSNEAHCALTAGVYLAVMGKTGLCRCAELSHSKAVYLKEQLRQIGFEPVHDGPFFHEFVTQCPCDAEEVLALLQKNNILGGLPLDGNRILWCTTELNTKEGMDAMIQLLKEGCA